MKISKNIIISLLMVSLATSIGLNFYYILNYKKTDAKINPDALIKNKDSKIVIEEFSDFQCQFCSSAQDTMKQLKRRYEGKIEIIYRHFPLEFHKYAQKAAEASECARDQNKFEQYSEILFKNQDKLDSDSLKLHAAMLGLNADNFNKCLVSGAKAKIVQKDMQDGIEKGVDGTPAFFINGKKIAGAQPYEVFKREIDAKLVQRVE